MDHSAESHTPMTSPQDRLAEEHSVAPSLEYPPTDFSPPRIENSSSPVVSAENERAAMEEAQRQMNEALQQQANQDMHMENPDAASAVGTSQAPLQPEPTAEKIVSSLSAKKPFIAGALSQVKDKLSQLFQGIKKFLFPQKGPKPPRPTSFKNLGAEGKSQAVSFKQQSPSGAGI